MLPGAHRISLRFEKPAATIGLRDLAPQRGEGVCDLEFFAKAGADYWLGSRPVGTDWTMRNWDGKWEGWVATDAAGKNILVKCTSGAPGEEPAGVAVAAGALPSAPVVAEPAVAQNVGSIRLGTWNTNGLGVGGDRNFEAVAAVIENNFDIVALTNVAGLQGYEKLMASLGSGWNGMVSSSIRKGERGEHDAIVHRRAAVRPCSGWNRLVRASESGGGAELADRFEQEPVFSCFEAVPAGKRRSVDFILAAYRATWGDGDSAAVAAEVRLLDRVFAAMARSRPGERDLIVAGRINLAAAEVPLATSATDRTRGSGSALNLLGEIVPGLRDRVLVHDPKSTGELIGTATVLDVRGVAADPGYYRRVVSNHLPLMVRLRTDIADDD